MEYRKGAKDKDVGVIQSLLNRAREKAISSQQYKIPNDWEYLKIDNDFGKSFAKGKDIKLAKK